MGTKNLLQGACFGEGISCLVLFFPVLVWSKLLARGLTPLVVYCF